MAVSNADIVNYLQANPGMSDQQIAAAMNQYGVSTGQMAAATGVDQGAVQSRYDAAIGAGGGGSTAASQVATPSYTSTDIQNYLKANPGISDQQIASAMDKYGVNTQQMADATGLGLDTVQNRYNAAEGLISGATSGGSTAGVGTGINTGTIGTNAATNTGVDNTTGTKTTATATDPTTQAITGWLQQHPGATDQEIAAAMKQNNITPEQMAKATGLDLTQVNARFNTANSLNDLTSKYSTLQNQFNNGTKALTDQLAALQAKYDALANKKTTTSTSSMTPTGGNGSLVDNSGGSASTSVADTVYGPDGTSYSSPAAARAAGIYNYTRVKPTTQTAPATPTTPVPTGGGLIQNAASTNGSLYTNPATVSLPPGVQAAT